MIGFLFLFLEKVDVCLSLWLGVWITHVMSNGMSATLTVNRSRRVCCRGNNFT